MNNIEFKKIIFVYSHCQQILNMSCSSHNQIKIKKLQLFLMQFQGNVVFFVENKKEYFNLLQITSYLKISLIQIYNLNVKIILNMYPLKKYFFILNKKINGCIDTKNNFAFICKNDFLENQLIDTFCCQNHKCQEDDNKKKIELKINQLVVHFTHGIGRYQGLVILNNNRIDNEFCIIEYANKDKLYVPVTSLHLITPYYGIINNNVTLHKLGNKQWIQERKKIEKNIYDSTAILLDVYADRANTIGFSFNRNDKRYDDFCHKFPFTLTIDQKTVMNEVLEDMEKSTPMDRLICGDVGFGKTEIAMRASCIAIVNYKQVAILAPTTLLVQQHYNNFIDRFKNLSVNIKILSRLCTSKETEQVITEIKEGKLNILIGTHQMLSKKIKWFNLGLLIIDEEHKFGVMQKEKIKSLFPHIDILTLTATPIPRTLNMAMHGLRDLSIISTPPDKRLAIKTIVKEYDIKLIKKTILKEIYRGGQIYYVFNTVKNIENISNKLIKLIPEAKIKVAHGGMDKRLLKKIMYEFCNKHFDVLVCTTIIETGIDIPYVNTIIIENSDQFGLSQLHQLRGRIGRSHHQAYALLLVKNYNNINENAKKRLESICSFQNVGDGLILSHQDLEIRGIGEMLGHDQSGHMGKIGFILYKEMLSNAINNNRINGTMQPFNEMTKYHPAIEINVPSLLLDTYINNVNTRINFYRKIAMCTSKKEINRIENELIYRFGTMPLPVKNFIIIALIRVMSNHLGIKKIFSNEKGGFIIISNSHCINLSLLFTKIQLESNNWNITNTNKLRFVHHDKNNEERLIWVLDFVNELYNSRISI
ncbi:MAG: transcription-repair coupling factor [Buchnera aphidicola (Eriosoma harunire)]